MLYLAGYFIFINIAAFVAFYLDKQRALKGNYRTSEKHLLLLVLLGGIIGSLIAIYKFRHKNRKTSFKFSVGFALLVNVLLSIVVFNQYIKLQG